MTDFVHVSGGKPFLPNAMAANHLVPQQVMMVGLGPHARRIYMHYFGKHNLAPAAIVELEEQKDMVATYLATHQLKSDVYFVPTTQRDAETLSPTDVRALDALIRQNSITHAILSTEPKAHKAYIKYFLSKGIHTLTDKPITAPTNPITHPGQAAQIEHDYDDLMALYAPQKDKGVRLSVQCQRRFHPAYAFIRSLLEDLAKAHQIPVTHMEVYHCDGMWNMPDEFLSRENHPYKYGYGKLYHSGYHFVDLAAWLMQATVPHLPPSKQPDNASIYTSVTRPSDFMNQINGNDYARLMGTNRFQDLTHQRKNDNFATMGEIDFNGILTFKNGEDVLTHCQLTLLQNGFSRRAWDKLPPDTYKGNGRVRHERLNIQMGPLVNIQIHSYQSKEVKERGHDHDGVGSLEHFDIHIFRNTALIGGLPVQTLTVKDVLGESSVHEGFIGYNEHARERCLLSFLKNEEGPSDLADHALGIKIMRAAYTAMSLGHYGQPPLSYFRL